MENPKVSVVLSVFNEAENIGRALESVKWADELIVIDNGSTDKTVEIARKYHAQVYERENNPMLNVNKNYGFSKATGDWIISLDGDEEFTPELYGEIINRISDPGDMAGYWIPRKNIIFGKWIRHGLWWPDIQLRLFKNNLGRFPGKHVHEKIEVNGPTQTLINPYIHHSYKGISQYLAKMDRIYTINEVENMRSAGYQVSWFDAVRFPVSDFMKTYFAQKGYEDGLHGLVLSLLQAFYSFLVFAKLWEKSGFPEQDIPLDKITTEFKKEESDLNYWLINSKISRTTGFLPRLYYKILLKLRIPV